MENIEGMGLISCSPDQRGTVCVENHYFCKVIIKGEGIMNYQFARIYSIEPLGLFLGLPDNISLQKSGLKFHFKFQFLFVYFSVQSYPFESVD